MFMDQQPSSLLDDEPSLWRAAIGFVVSLGVLLGLVLSVGAGKTGIVFAQSELRGGLSDLGHGPTSELKPVVVRD